MILLGIDPGVNGALALFDTAERSVTVTDMPDTTAGLNSLIGSFPPVVLCVLEKPYYPKVIGTTHVARIAEAFGKILCALDWCGVPLVLVRPAEWKAALNLSPNKAASREAASQLFPDSADQWRLKKHDGRAEAALLAWYGQRKVKL